MDLFTVASFLIVISAAFGFINVKFVKLPSTIGLMVIAILFTIGITILGQFSPGIKMQATNLVAQIDFEAVILDVMLGFLLFAGALHTNFEQLRVQRWPILIFATLGVLISTFVVAGLMYYLLAAFGFQISFINCLLFGALISPTDPIAVLGILKKAGVPKKLETKIVGESLFNDGVGVVVFLTILSIAGVGHEAPTVGGIAKLFCVEVLGGLLLGGLLGYLAYRLMKAIDDYDTEVLITLAVVTGGYILAHQLHVSAPLAMVVAGLIVGNDTIRGSAMSEITEAYVDKFWELMDVLLNAILFVLIGLEMLVLTYDHTYLAIGLIAIFVVLMSRYIALYLPVRFFRKRLDFVPKTALIMTWGGLRGGISIALALSLPQELNRELFLFITYGIVVFSIIVQGLTVGKLVKKLA